MIYLTICVFSGQIFYIVNDVVMIAAQVYQHFFVEN